MKYLLIFDVWECGIADTITPEISASRATSFKNAMDKHLFLEHDLEFEPVKGTRVKLLLIDGFNTEVVYDSDRDKLQTIRGE